MLLFLIIQNCQKLHFDSSFVSYVQRSDCHTHVNTSGFKKANSDNQQQI